MQFAPAVPRDVLKRLLGAAFIGAAALAAPAYAGTILFENQFGGVGDSEFLTEASYQLGYFSNAVGAAPGDAVGAYVDGSDPQSCIGGSCPVNNPTTYYAALNDSYIDIMSQTAGASFQVKSFDASFIGGTAPGTSFPAISGLLRIQGYFADGGSVYETYQLGGPTNNVFNFGHYNTSAAFGSLKFVELAIFGFECNVVGNCSAFSTDRSQFGIDNLKLAEVPEPSSALMVALGLVGLGAATRRRNAKAQA